MVIDETDGRFYLAESTIKGAGRGVFAAQPLQPGDRLHVIGALIEPGSLADQCTTYADEYKMRVGSRLIIPCGFGGMINHSDRPNLVKQVEGGDLYLVAIRPIAAGEEVFYTYSSYARERFHIDG